MIGKQKWSAPVVTEVVIQVARSWMDACGYRSHDGRFQVVVDIYYRMGKQFIDVVHPSDPAYQPFTLAMFLHDATWEPA